MNLKILENNINKKFKINCIIEKALDEFDEEVITIYLEEYEISYMSAIKEYFKSVMYDGNITFVYRGVESE
ncbi:MAG: hypothetical protein ACRC28_02695 [Clostridium sp.]|uniref:hypothetical protein n=1 Tax=Clostridium sp. TaxID=1506 RepID=UPI003F2C3EF8